MAMAEKEYIERKSIYSRVKRHTNPYGKPTLDYKSGVKVLDMIKQESSADVVEVVHAEWLYHECVSSYDGTKSGYSCSACGAFVEEEVFETDEIHKNFCGNCGAKMDGERKEYQ